MSRDTFDRITTFGMGTGWTWSNADSEYGSASASDFYVDGEKFVLPSGHWDSYELDAVAPAIGTVQFDIYLPALADYTTEGWPDLQFSISHLSAFTVVFRFMPEFDGTTNYRFGTTFGASTTVTIDPDNWYTAKMSYNEDVGGLNPLQRYKLWKTGTAEPGWMYTSTTTAGAAADDELLDIMWSGEAETYFDNFVLESGFDVGILTADAFIVSAGGGFTVTDAFAASAVKRETFASTLSVDAFLDAYTTRRRHYRDRDHDDLEALSDVAISQAVGRYAAGTTLDVVLADLATRLAALDTLSYGDFTVDGVIKKVVASTISAGARIFKTGTQSGFTFRENAVVKKTQPRSMTADAVIA